MEDTYAVTNPDDLIGEPEDVTSSTAGGNELHLDGGAEVFTNLDTQEVDEFTVSAYIQLEDDTNAGTSEVFGLDMGDSGSISVGVTETGEVVVDVNGDETETGLTVDAGEWTNFGGVWSAEDHSLTVYTQDEDGNVESEVISDVFPDDLTVSVSGLTLGDVNNPNPVAIDGLTMVDQAWTEEEFTESSTTYETTSNDETGTVILEANNDETVGGAPVVTTVDSNGLVDVTSGLTLPATPLTLPSSVDLGPGVPTGSSLTTSGASETYSDIQSEPLNEFSVGTFITPVLPTSDEETTVIAVDLDENREAAIVIDGNDVHAVVTESDGTEHTTDPITVPSDESSYVGISWDSETGEATLRVTNDVHGTTEATVQDVMTGEQVDVASVQIGDETTSAVIEVDNVNIMSTSQTTDEFETASTTYINPENPPQNLIGVANFDDDTSMHFFDENGEPTQIVEPVVDSPLPHVEDSTLDVPGSGSMFSSTQGDVTFTDINTGTLDDGFTTTMLVDIESTSTQDNILSTTVTNQGDVTVHFVDGEVTATFRDNNGDETSTDSIPIPTGEGQGDFTSVSTSITPEGTFH